MPATGWSFCNVDAEEAVQPRRSEELYTCEVIAGCSYRWWTYRWAETHSSSTTDAVPDNYVAASDVHGRSEAPLTSGLCMSLLCWNPAV
jgi:hypothetical protein